MSSVMYERMRANPKFQELVTKRSRFAWTLAAIVLTMFYGFVMVVAFNPASLGQPVSEGSMLTVGVAVELFMFIFFWSLALPTGPPAGPRRRPTSTRLAAASPVSRTAWQLPATTCRPQRCSV
jgi:uncharacterized membrane protein (DUF485 family)